MYSEKTETTAEYCGTLNESVQAIGTIAKNCQTVTAKSSIGLSLSLKLTVYIPP